MRGEFVKIGIVDAALNRICLHLIENILPLFLKLFNVSNGSYGIKNK